MRSKNSRRGVWTFFYGSFMNPRVLARAGVRPATPRRGRLDGWDIEIRPRATLVPSKRHSVYGILAKVTHADLRKLYVKDWFGFGAYLPEAVMVSDRQRRRVPAMCYIAWRRGEGRPTQEYLDKVVATAVKYKFPHSYIERLRSFGR
jgi:cation transport regulator ChaC